MYRLLILILCVALPALAQVTVVDQAGREVTIAQPPERVVSLYGVATLYLYALGVPEKLVLGTYVGLKPGSPSWATLSAVDPKLPEKFSQGKPSLEEVLAQEPDLVLASARKDPEAAEELAPFGIPVLLLFAEDLEGVKSATGLLGKVFGAEARAAKLLSYLDEKVQAISSLIAERELSRPRVLFCGAQPFRVASGDMYQSEMIALAGGEPVTKRLAGYWQDVNAEQVLLWDPEVIFIAPYGKVLPEDILGDPVWQGVTAVRAGRVYKMPRVFSPWDVPTPESSLGILWMAVKLHPELPIDLATEARAFYREFYGYELPEELLLQVVK